MLRAVTASAPGKLILAGEYAVLDGPPAVVVAVTRRAAAHVSDQPQRLSEFLRAARDELAATFGADHSATRAAARVIVDSQALRNSSGVKLGLGSSAAATVAALTAALNHSHDTIDRDQLHRLAFRAHAAAQAPRGSRGSGADIAACVYGGALVVNRASLPDDEPIATRAITLPKQLVLVPVWSGAPADTPSLVARVRALRASDRATYDTAITRIADAATLLIGACEADDADAAVAAIGRGDQAVGYLANVAQVALVQPIHTTLASIAERCGGRAKPTGAGAGDISIAAFSDADNAAQFRAQMTELGVLLPDFDVDCRGASS